MIFKMNARSPKVVFLSILFSSSLLAEDIKKSDAALLLYYDFESSSGETILDKSDSKSLSNLQILDPSKAQFKNGGIHFMQGTTARSRSIPSDIIKELKRTSSLSFELWFEPSNLRQKGPARIFSLSGGTSDRNFTVGQEGKSFQVRLRTNGTSNNGLPALESSNILKTTLTHAVYTFKENQAELYINGELVKRQKIEGSFSNWNDNYRIFLGNESNGSRPWLGTIYSLYLFDKALSKNEIVNRFQNKEGNREAIAINLKAKKEKFFERSVAPIIATHCLECHDTANSKGDLDLSQKVTAFEDNLIISKGKSNKSLLWETIVKDEMPKKRALLTAEEKKVIKEWIDGGAHWSLEKIDPAVYVHSSNLDPQLARRLTVDEYISTVNDTLGVDISIEAKNRLPADLRADGFSNTSYNLNVDLEHIQAYSDLASEIVKAVDIQKFSKRFTNNQSFTDKSMASFLRAMGHWVLRGPLTNEELVIYRGITTSAVAGGSNYYDSAKLVLEAMLQSPRFIYRIESNDTGSLVSNNELAVRLSYLIWGSSPDLELHKEAKNGKLNNPSKIQYHVQRMMKDPRAIEQSIQFLSQWLNLNQLSNLRPDKKHFPKWNFQLAKDMRLETVTFFRDLVWEQDRPLTDLFNAQFTYLTPALATHYGIQPKDEKGLKRYDLKGTPSRGGILTQGSTLTMGGDEASMVTRGLFILNNILRGVVKDPPPCVDTTPVSSEPGISQRIIAERRIANSSCGGCHSRFEPLAFGLERFDGLGTYREKDNYENILKQDGELLIPGDSESIHFKSSSELMDIIAKSDRVMKTLVWKMVQFAMGRPLSAEDVSYVDKIYESAQNKGSTYKDVILSIALSEMMSEKRIQD